MKLIALLLLCVSAHSAALRIACGGPGGTDSSGSVWQADTGSTGGSPFVNPAGLDYPYRNLRYATSFSYRVPVLPGPYKVTLLFVEPNKTGPGQRRFNVSINETPVATGLDLFAEGGVMTAVTHTYDVTVTDGTIRIALAASLGNAVISGILIDPVIAPPPPLPQVVCERTLGNGVNALGYTVFAGDMAYPIWACQNTTDRILNLLSFRCRSDQLASATVMLPDATGTFQLATNTIPCFPGEGTATIVPGASYKPGEIVWLVVSVPYVPNNPPVSTSYGNARQVLLTATFSAGERPSVLKACNGSGPGWNCAGILWAKLSLSDGTTINLLGTAMEVPTSPGITWTDR